MSPAVDLETELEVLMARAGVTVPETHRDALLAGYAALREQVALLRSPRTAAAEPANIFRLHKLRSA